MWLGSTAVLLVLALGLTQLDLGLAEGEQFANDVDAVEGAEVLARAGFAGGGGAPLQVVVPDAGRAGAVADAVGGLDGVARVGEPEHGEPGARLDVGLDVDPYGARALALVPEVRRAAREADPGALVGGSLAEDYDTREAAERDNLVVMPAALAVVLLILLVLLRAVVLPLLLMVTVVCRSRPLSASASWRPTSSSASRGSRPRCR